LHRGKIKSIAGKYSGKKAVIICNGPGLRNIEFQKIGEIYTFGLNNINSIFEKTHFRPSSIVAVNPYVIKQNADFYSETDIPLFLDYRARKIVNVKSETYLFHTSDHPYFAKDCEFSVYEGFSVTYVAMQLAFHMGFSDVALVGCDHKYNYQGEPNSVLSYDNRVGNHFADKYYPDDSEWQLPDLRASEYFFDLARREFTRDGRLLVNCSMPSDLTTIPRMTLEEFLMNEG
tara:strand:+ start:212 stop:904 length:693 start_codon:yes stop_codon:yes gene_type:complete